MEGLRVVLLPEGDDLVAREGVRAELERVASLEILEIEGHGPAAYPVRRDGVNVTGSDRTPRRLDQHYGLYPCAVQCIAHPRTVHADSAACRRGFAGAVFDLADGRAGPAIVHSRRGERR